MHRFEVYKHTSPSGRSYVGWTSQGWSLRWLKHVSDARLGKDTAPAFHRAIRKYGADTFRHEVLEVMTTEAGAKRAEQLWIARLSGGYNISAGGDGATGASWSWSAESRARASVRMTGVKDSDETRARKAARLREQHARGGRPSIGDWRRGRPMSAETRAKIGAANRAAHVRKAGV